jgi:hypothetical protein
MTTQPSNEVPDADARPTDMDQEVAETGTRPYGAFRLRWQGRDQILRFGLTLLNHKTRIAPTTTTNKIVSAHGVTALAIARTVCRMSVNSRHACFSSSSGTRLSRAAIASSAFTKVLTNFCWSNDMSSGVSAAMSPSLVWTFLDYHLPEFAG